MQGEIVNKTNIKKSRSKIKAFFYVFYKSATSISYYKELLGSTKTFTFKYYVTLMLIVSTVVATGVSIQLTPDIIEQATDIKETVVSAFPEDFEIMLRDGEWSINRPEPYMIKAPEGLFETETSEGNQEDRDNVSSIKLTNLVIFDHKGTIRDLKNQNSLILVNEKNVVIQNPNTGVDTIPINSFPSGTFNKADVSETSARINEVLKITPYIVFGAVFGILLFYNLTIRLMSIFILGAILLSIGKTRSLGGAYATYVKIATHLITLPACIEAIVIAFGLTVPIPFWYFGLSLILGVYILNHVSRDLGGSVSGDVNMSSGNPVAKGSGDDDHKAESDFE